MIAAELMLAVTTIPVAGINWFLKSRQFLEESALVKSPHHVNSFAAGAP
jgi:hypothetical protein